LSARNKIESDLNVQKCPRCDTLHFGEWEGEQIGAVRAVRELEANLKTECAMKCGPFCWQCGCEWDGHHRCDSSFRSELIAILSAAKTKKIGEMEGVPEIRCCPKCGQLITHCAACKHIQCRSCRSDFCFICLVPKKEGRWQCGSHSDFCPIADRQTKETLPDLTVIHKKSFRMF